MCSNFLGHPADIQTWDCSSCFDISRWELHRTWHERERLSRVRRTSKKESGNTSEKTTLVCQRRPHSSLLSRGNLHITKSSSNIGCLVKMKLILFLEYSPRMSNIEALHGLTGGQADTRCTSSPQRRRWQCRPRPSPAARWCSWRKQWGSCPMSR